MRSRKKKKKSKYKLNDILYYSFCGLLLVLIFCVVWGRLSGGEPGLFGYQLKTVMSGSMEPTFKTGSLILVKDLEDKNFLKKGDVITFRQNQESLTTHRIAKVLKEDGKTAFQTKGDNNKFPDMNPVYSGNVVAEYKGIAIPFLGYLFNFLNSPKGISLLFIIPGALLLGYSFITIRSAIKEMERRLKTSAHSQEPDGKAV